MIEARVSRMVVSVLGDCGVELSVKRRISIKDHRVRDVLAVVTATADRQQVVLRWPSIDDVKLGRPVTVDGVEFPTLRAGLVHVRLMLSTKQAGLVVERFDSHSADAMAYATNRFTSQ